MHMEGDVRVCFCTVRWVVGRCVEGSETRGIVGKSTKSL